MKKTDKRLLTNKEKDLLSIPDDLRSDAVFLSAYGYKPKEHFADHREDPAVRIIARHLRMAADEIERLRGKDKQDGFRTQSH